MLTIFSIAMGLLETAVVIYLRELYYSGGFSFPLNTIDNQIIAKTEILREAATIIMLFGVGYFFGHNFITRFAGFIYSFAIWDLFYYLFLKILLNWPETLQSWDVLFLIPVTWVGPVIAPVLVSLTMVLLAFIIISLDKNNDKIRLKFIDWLLLLFSALTIIVSFTIDNITYIINLYGIEGIWNITQDQLFTALKNYIPTEFNWLIFGLGELGLLGYISYFWLKNKRKPFPKFRVLTIRRTTS